MSWSNHAERDHDGSPKPRRSHTIMSARDVAAGKKSSWPKLELVGTRPVSSSIALSHPFGVGFMSPPPPFLPILCHLQGTRPVSSSIALSHPFGVGFMSPPPPFLPILCHLQGTRPVSSSIALSHPFGVGFMSPPPPFLPILCHLQGTRPVSSSIALSHPFGVGFMSPPPPFLPILCHLQGPVCNLSPNLFKMTHLTSLFMNGIQLSHLPPAISKLCCLTHLDLSCNQLQSLPAELGDVITLRELLMDNNYIRALPNELGKLFRVYNLGISGNPLPADIYNIYNKPNGTQNLLSHLLNNLPVISHQPPRRPWIAVNERNKTALSSVFTVMCYNILCDKLATRQLYGYCPDWALEWKYRRKGIMDEIRHYNADIIALQEVETGEFCNFLQSLRREGYDGIFAAKSRAKTMANSEKQQVDGCAIFYKVNKFSLLKQQVVEFNQIAMSSAEKGADNMLNRVMTKDNIGLVALLFTKGGAFEDGLMPPASQVNQPLLVCSPHIHWDPEYCDVKLIQMMMLVRELKSVVDDAINVFQPNCVQRDANNIPLVLCGDFNSLPESGVIEFLSRGSVPQDHPDFKQLAYKDSLLKLGYSADMNRYHHPFHIICAYNNHMPYTNYTCDFKGVIDYIFFSQRHLRLLGLLGPIDPEWMKENKVSGCPHPHIPSDHFPLLVQLELSPIQVTRSPLANGVTLRR